MSYRHPTKTYRYIDVPIAIGVPYCGQLEVPICCDIPETAEYDYDDYYYGRWEAPLDQQEYSCEYTN